MDDRDKAKKMLFPGLAVAGLVVLVIGVLVIGGSGGGGTNSSGNNPDSDVLPSNLKIEDVKIGNGPEVKRGATVTVHYVGTLEDGTIFDSSRAKGKPLTISLARVVKGWQFGIPGMKPGGVRKLVIPPELGYGPDQAGDIPPNSTLKFEVELLSSP